MNGINSCLNKDGSNAATGNLNIGSNRLTNVAAATARTDAAQVGQVQDGSYIWLGTTGGTATAMTATATPAITSYAAGQKFRMKPNTASTGQIWTSHTLNVNGIGAIPIIEQEGQSPTIGSWFNGSGRFLELVYVDGFFVISQASQYWTTYTSTLTPQNGTASSVVFNIAKFIRVKNTCSVQIYVTWTQNTASAAYIDVSCPIRPASANQGVNVAISTGANLEIGLGLIGNVIGSGIFRCYDKAQAQILTGAKNLIINASYEIG